MVVSYEDIKKYELYLAYLEKKLGAFFEEQSPYIFCKEGCSYCCEKGEYPFTEIEFAYLMLGTRFLNKETFNQIEKNMLEVKNAKKEHSGDKKFMYKCPFLIDKKCSLYKYRGIICRTHGLAFFSKENKLLVPACVDRGLNYSNVYDFENKTISDEKFEKSGIKQEPLAHNVGMHFMTNNSFLDSIDLKFGEIKPMIDWFK